MKVKVLDTSHFMAVLSQQEAYALGVLEPAGENGPLLNFTSFHSRLATAKILSVVCARYAFCCRNKKISVRALTCTEESIVLLFSAELNRRSRFRIKSAQSSLLFRFSQTDALMDCMERLYACKKNDQRLRLCASLFAGQGEYFLALSPKRLYKRRWVSILTEYASPYGEGQNRVAYLKEHCTLLSTDAVQELGAAMVKQTSPLSCAERPGSAKDR